ncbi:MAG TPA: pseudouridine synthase [Solirubrobacteraceae bacterium]|nr:pseudouridine synthase [Solirubrobacteraceae bacterium]
MSMPSMVAAAMRLAKFLATAGVASRRASEQVIRDGRVTVDGLEVTDPARDVGEQDAVAVDGVPVGPAGERAVYAVNKPAGVVSTAHDPQRRPTIVSLVPSALRLYPVGRLDIDTTGLILLTNDGELANRLTHPRYEVPKTYRVRVWGAPVSRRAVEALRAGVQLDDGLTAPARVRKVAWDTIELTIREGRNRQVKRMCEHVGHRVRSLQRVAFGPLMLGDLPEGGHRVLSAAEVEALSEDP